MEQAVAASTIYQLRVVLRRISPLIWRRLLVSSQTTIADLHTVLQISLGWEDDHLHRFHIHGKDYGVGYVGGISFKDNPREVCLADFRLHRGERFLYVYDLSAQWECDIRLEAILAPSPRRHYPVCTQGARAVPPEFCRDGWDYLKRLDDFRVAETRATQVLVDVARVVLDPGSQDLSLQEAIDLEAVQEALEELKPYGEWQPEQFDRHQMNAQLRAWAEQGGHDEAEGASGDDRRGRTGDPS